MAVDKLVDSTQLDSDLTSVANAIRTRGGTSAQLAFPNGFVSAIGDIPTGSSYDFLSRSAAIGACTTSVTTFSAYIAYCRTGITSVTALSATEAADYSFYGCSGLQSVNIPLLNKTGIEAFRGCSSLTSVNFQNLVYFGGGDGSSYSKTGCFYGCTSLTSVNLPLLRDVFENSFRNCSKLEVLDFPAVTRIRTNAFNGCTKLATLVLRSTSIVTLNNVAAFTGTPFASGKSGGTIYIPESLYNHLGDGTSLDYRAATNWSTLNGYGTVTWAKIEGSIYDD